EGKLSVSDPITRHLPDYPSYGDGITIEHLLTHTSGIVSYTGIPGYMQTQVRKDVTVEELIDVFKDLPVEFAPGERYAYSNSGYILLGAIVEAASGTSYEEFVRERVFEPLGMKQSYYGCSRCIIPQRASGYQSGNEGYANQRYLSFTQPYAAGSLMMTVEDLYRWNRALFGGKLVSPESLEMMTTPFVLNGGDTTDYAYGLVPSDLRGHRAIRHGGGIFGFVREDYLDLCVDNNPAGKTGTTQDYRDAWFMSFPPGVVVAVWVGRDDFQPIPGNLSGSRAAAPIAKAIYAAALKQGLLNAQGHRPDQTEMKPWPPALLDMNGRGAQPQPSYVAQDPFKRPSGGAVFIRREAGTTAVEDLRPVDDLDALLGAPRPGAVVT
ncbi:hypothetical protein LCGC14_2932680, partial [marine sediment metagenome]